MMRGEGNLSRLVIVLSSVGGLEIFQFVFRFFCLFLILGAFSPGKRKSFCFFFSHWWLSSGFIGEDRVGHFWISSCRR